jgi:thiol-disulfide isomerase/thioredoxin
MTWKKYLFPLGVLALLALTQGPVWWKNFQVSGKVIPAQSAKVLGESREVLFPPAGGAVVIFWASWCAPCKLEMQRLKSSVEAKRIPSERLFAINLFESPEVQAQFQRREQYPFTFLELRPFPWEIQVTPTLLLLENGRVVSQSSGLSLWGIWRAESLF